MENGAHHPQGVAVDQKGNVWIASNYGPESAPGQGNVVVYPGGDPSKAFTISGSGLNHPFAVQIDGYGRAWVTNAGLGAPGQAQPADWRRRNRGDRRRGHAGMHPADSRARRPSSSTATACARQTATPLPGRARLLLRLPRPSPRPVPASRAGRLAWGWAAITAAFVVLAAGAAPFFLLALCQVVTCSP